MNFIPPITIYAIYEKTKKQTGLISKLFSKKESSPHEKNELKRFFNELTNSHEKLMQELSKMKCHIQVTPQENSTKSNKIF